jgi:hypothetical protein
MTFDDINRGSDLEFGQSIYEPFGISQAKALGSGALCVLSNVCGCLGFIHQVAQGKALDNLIVADYVTLPEGMAQGGYRQTQVLGQPERDRIEAAQAQRVAQEIMARLPTSRRKQQSMLGRGYRIGQKMNWDVVVQNYLMPALVYAASK